MPPQRRIARSALKKKVENLSRIVMGLDLFHNMFFFFFFFSIKPKYIVAVIFTPMPEDFACGLLHSCIVLVSAL